MLYEIVKRYEKFSDALLLEFNYFYKKHSIELVVRAMNSQNNYEFEDVKLIFEGVIEFRFVKEEGAGVEVVFEALIIRDKEGAYVFDFSPTYFSEHKVELNPLSDFMIKSEKVRFESLSSI